MQDRSHLNREETFEALRRADVARATIHYHGGNDESFVEETELQDSSGGFVEAELGEKLESALEEGVYEVLGDSFGDSIPGIQGTIVYEVEKERVFLHNSYLDWIEEEPTEA